MAYVLDGSINEEVILGILRAKMRTLLVGGTAVRFNTIPTGVASIKIPRIEDFSDEVYTGADITVSDATDSYVILPADQARDFGKTVNKVDDYESALNVISTVLEAGVYSMAKSTDKHIFETLAGTSNSIPAVTVDKTNVIKVIVDLGIALDENDVPAEGRALYITPAMSGALAEANITLNTGTAEQAVVTGFVGVFGGFAIYKTNNLFDGAVGKEVIACVPNATDFGQSFQTEDIVSTEKNFKWLIKGLTTYGAVINEESGIVKVDVN